MTRASATILAMQDKSPTRLAYTNVWPNCWLGMMRKLCVKRSALAEHTDTRVGS